MPVTADSFIVLLSCMSDLGVDVAQLDDVRLGQILRRGVGRQLIGARVAVKPDRRGCSMVILVPETTRSPISTGSLASMRSGLR